MSGTVLNAFSLICTSGVYYLSNSRFHISDFPFLFLHRARFSTPQVRSYEALVELRIGINVNLVYGYTLQSSAMVETFQSASPHLKFLGHCLV